MKAYEEKLRLILVLILEIKVFERFNINTGQLEDTKLVHLDLIFLCAENLYQNMTVSLALILAAISIQQLEVTEYFC
jgi:hypothetical protein